MFRSRGEGGSSINTLSGGTMSREGVIGRSCLGEHPIERLFESSKNARGNITLILSQNFKHSAKPIPEIPRNNQGAAGVRSEDSALRYLPNIVSREIELSDLGEISNLREAGVKLGIVDEFILVRQTVGSRKNP